MRKIKKLLKTSLCGLVLNFVPSCGVLPLKNLCVNQNSMLFFRNNYSGFGILPLTTEDIRDLANCRDFDIYDHHYGGYGDTLEMRSINNGTHLLWSYNQLGHIFLGPEWEGITDKGIKMGDSLSKFISRYPNTTECPEGSSYDYQGGHRRWYSENDSAVLIGEFNENKRLIGLCLTIAGRCEPSWWSERMGLKP